MNRITQFNTARTVVLLLGLLAVTVFIRLSEPEPPQPIVVKEITAEQIKEEVKSEQREKQIRRATATARKVFRANHVTDRYSDLVGRTAYECGISARLLAAVIVVESSGRADAVSGKNSIGLMQVNPRVWGHRKDLYDPAFNVSMGAHILRQYVGRYGLVEGLHRYNGLGNPTNSYAVKVLDTGGIAWPS